MNTTTKLQTMYESVVARLAELEPGAPDFAERLDVEISLLIKLKYADCLKERRADGTPDWSLPDKFLTQVEAGQHRYGIVPGWQDREVAK